MARDAINRVCSEWGSGEQGVRSKEEEFSPLQEQHPAPLPLFNAQ
ncbi:hypothetical protein COO91_00660 [Nostoc flagelliforme CCNUN1]|uniref:Uncharacterized protein n=1 Tax=Nostoc flagelliforme CCNUN1 TaxID=2038116 RepID=A0A2K8SH82_9NOSO|nr:hypothetical protein COO91_00660 [Nostoc flagelliforme CCNUN1]